MHLINSFLRGRVTREAFIGLPLTILAVAFILILALFGGITEDVINADPIVRLDARVAAFFATYREPGLAEVFVWLTLLAKGQVVGAIAVAAGAIFLLWGERHRIVPLLVTVLGAEATMQAVKRLVDRPRPGLEFAYYLEKSFSFPSGHATQAMALYGFLVYALARAARTWTRRVPIILAGLLVVLSVGLSRMYLGVHYLSDVLGGYLVGLLWLIIGIALAEFLRSRPSQVGILEPTTTRARLALTSAVIAAALIFYVVFAVRYVPPQAVASDPGAVTSSPAVRE